MTPDQRHTNMTIQWLDNALSHLQRTNGFLDGSLPISQKEGIYSLQHAIARVAAVREFLLLSSGDDVKPK